MTKDEREAVQELHARLVERVNFHRNRHESEFQVELIDFMMAMAYEEAASWVKELL